MTIEEALNAHLRGYGGLSGLNNRVRPGPLPLESPLPAITYFRVSRRATQHRSSRRAQHSRDRFQFDLWGSSYGSVVNTKSAFMDAMAEFERVSNPRVEVALIADDRDAYEAEPGRWRAIVDYFISYAES